MSREARKLALARNDAFLAAFCAKLVAKGQWPVST
jgi:hypothetical protein